VRDRLVAIGRTSDLARGANNAPRAPPRLVDQTVAERLTGAGVI